jgi:hypothetical protein
MLRPSLVFRFQSDDCVRAKVQARWKIVDLLLSVDGGHAEIVLHLKVHPELRWIAEPVCEAQCGVARDGPLAVDNLRNAVGRNAKLARQFGR